MRRICIYACYPRDSLAELPQYVHIALKSLKDVGYEVWLVINRTDYILSHAALDLVDDVMVRENSCHDWGAYAHAVHRRRKDVESADSVLLTNDSYILPVFGLDTFKSVLHRMWDKNINGAWCMTASYERGWHMQSYWMEFGRGVLSDERFYNKLMSHDDMKACQNVHELISKFEIQDRSLFGTDYTFESAFPIDEESFRGNPYVLHWSTDLYPRKFPLFKYTVLKNHHKWFTDGDKWRTLLRKTGELGDHLVDDALGRWV